MKKISDHYTKTEIFVSNYCEQLGINYDEIAFYYSCKTLEIIKALIAVLSGSNYFVCRKIDGRFLVCITTFSYRKPKKLHRNIIIMAAKLSENFQIMTRIILYLLCRKK